jgi:hypothetical protein
MTVEQLLRKRVVVENKWPNCPFEVGDILIKDGDYYWVVGAIGWYSKYEVEDIEPFPYLMRPLEWWEEREVSEMPEYVKDIGDGEIFKVREWLDNSMSVIWLNDNKKMNHTGFHQASSEHFLPATPADYENYLKHKTK